MEDEERHSIGAWVMPDSLYSRRPGDGPSEMCRWSFVRGFYLLSAEYIVLEKLRYVLSRCSLATNGFTKDWRPLTAAFALVEKPRVLFGLALWGHNCKRQTFKSLFILFLYGQFSSRWILGNVIESRLNSTHLKIPTSNVRLWKL